MIPESGRPAGEGIGYPLHYSWAPLVAQLVKNPLATRIDLHSIPGLRKSPEVKGYPLQYYGLENSMECPWGCKESDTTERVAFSLSIFYVLLARTEPLVKIKTNNSFKSQTKTLT